MKETLRFGFILAVICMVAAGLLAGVNSLTQAKIMAQAQDEDTAGLREILPQAVRFEAVKKGDEVLYHRAFGQSGELCGIAFLASGKGYASTIDVLVGMRLDGTMEAIKVLRQNETPGLGARVAEQDFMDQFKGKRDPFQVQSITGATISSRSSHC